MDKSKKTSGKKSKTNGLRQSAAKGRDVTDSFNASDKAVPRATAAASTSIETPDGQKEDAELVRLRQENQELTELTRRHVAEISALRRSEASATELLNSLRDVSQSSGGKCFCAIYIVRSSFSILATLI